MADEDPVATPFLEWLVQLVHQKVGEPDFPSSMRTAFHEAGASLEHATDEDIRNAVRLLDCVEGAFFLDDPGAWKIVHDACAIADGMDSKKTQADRLRGIIEAELRRWKKHTSDRRRFDAATHLAGMLSFYEPLFKKLDVKFMVSQMNAAVRAKGNAKTGPVRVLARFAAKCEAYGLKSELSAYRFFSPSKTRTRRKTRGKVSSRR